MEIYAHELFDDATNEWKDTLVCTIHLKGESLEPITAKDICTILNERYGDYCIYFSTKPKNKKE